MVHTQHTPLERRQWRVMSFSSSSIHSAFFVSNQNSCHVSLAFCETTDSLFHS